MGKARRSVQSGSRVNPNWIANKSLLTEEAGISSFLLLSLLVCISYITSLGLLAHIALLSRNNFRAFRLRPSG